MTGDRVRFCARLCARSKGVVAAIVLCMPAVFVCAQELPPAPAPQSAQETAQAQKQVNTALQQRVLGLVPNYFVVYTPHPVPLTAKQKFKLALRTEIDPMALVGAGVSAAYGQSQNDPKSFGQGAEGYFKRVGATYGANAVGALTGDAIVPSILKQDPRYFYKGTGSVRTRFFYAVSNSFICMGDNGHWQVNVSQPTGSMATAVIEELEYPSSDRFRAGRIFKDFAVSELAGGAVNVFQEFFSRKFTFHLGGQKQPTQ